MMQSLVGIVRTEARDAAGARRSSRRSRSGPRAPAVTGHREYNPGWHTAIDLRNLLTVSEAITRSAIERKESRGGHFREDFPDKVAEFGDVQYRDPPKAATARWRCGACRCRRCRRS